MKKILKTIFALSILSCSAVLFARDYPDNTFCDIPKDGYQFVENAGKVIRYMYDVPGPKREGQEQKMFKKSALVYLPYGFDETNPEEKYNVLYLMHGGAQSPEWYFNGEYSGSLLKSLLDNMHDKGLIQNLIVCAVSFNAAPKSGMGGNANGFYKELTQSLMPVFEEKYHVIKDRNHRAFGGFSMGGMVTWTIFEHCLQDIAFYLPVSGDSWALGGNQGGLVSDQTARYLEKMVNLQGMTAEDFKIYAGCGEQEIATPNMVPQIEAMKKCPDTFKYTENFATGNLYFILCKGSGHDIVTVLRTLYNGLPKMF